MYRKKGDSPAGGLEVFLIHPGGPFWRNKDAGAWSIPKGQHEEGEEPLEAAKREFQEETGYKLSVTSYQPLGEAKLKSGKVIRAWAVEGDADPTQLKSNTTTIEWPPRSGKKQEFPEADRGAWFSLEEARKKIHPGQAPFIDALEKIQAGPRS